MFRRAAQILSLFTAGWLILPVGWCCIVPAVAAGPRTVEAEQPLPSCCGHKHKEKPEQKPAPETPECRCQSPEAPLPEVVKAQIDLAAVPCPTFAPDIDLPFEAVGFVARWDDPVPSPALHILHCSWLC